MAEIARLATRHRRDTACVGFLGSVIVQQPDYESWKHWAQQASGKGSMQAKALLAKLHAFGPSKYRDISYAIRLYEEASANGIPEAQLELAITIVKYSGIQNWTKIWGYVELAASHGLPAAVYLLGALKERNAGALVDTEKKDAFVKIESHYLTAAEGGVQEAQLRLGELLLNGEFVMRNVTGGETWLRRAINGGNCLAAMVLADYYARNDERDRHSVLFWITRAADLGYEPARFLQELLSITGYNRNLDTDILAAARRSQVRFAQQSPDLAKLFFPDLRSPGTRIEVEAWHIFRSPSSTTDHLRLGLLSLLDLNGGPNYGHVKAHLSRIETQSSLAHNVLRRLEAIASTLNGHIAGYKQDIDRRVNTY